MTTIAALIAARNVHQDEKARIDARAKALDGLITTIDQTIQSLVKLGGTTGDKYLDFVLAKRGLYSPLDALRYQAIDEGLRGMKGQMVLLVRHLHIANGVMSIHGRNTVLLCGVLDGEEMTFNSREQYPDCSLPFSHYAYEDQLSGGFYKVEGQLPEGLTGHSKWHGVFLLDGLDPKMYLPRLEHNATTIFIGSEVVKKWLADNEFPSIGERMFLALDTPIPAPAA